MYNITIANEKEKESRVVISATDVDIDIVKKVIDILLNDCPEYSRFENCMLKHQNEPVKEG